MRLEKPKHSPEIAIPTWAFGGFDYIVNAAASEGVKGTLLDEEDGIEARLPSFFVDSDGNGGPPVSDPLTIYIYLPFSEYSSGDRPFWSLSIESLIIDELNNESEDDGSMEEETKAFALRLRDRLRAIATQIDERVANLPK